MVTSEQIEEYREKGWVVLPSLLDETEVSVLNDALDALNHHEGPEVAKDGRVRRMWSTACICSTKGWRCWSVTLSW